MKKYTQDVLGERLYQERTRQNLTQVELEKRSGYRSNSISKWESSRMNMTVDALCSICNALGVTPNDLLEVDDE